MDILKLPTQIGIWNFIIFSFLFIVLYAGTIYIFLKRSPWFEISMCIDLLKVILYGLLAILTLIIRYDEVQHKLFLGIGPEYSIAEILVILLAIFECVSNVLGIREKIATRIKDIDEKFYKRIQELQK